MICGEVRKVETGCARLRRSTPMVCLQKEEESGINHHGTFHPKEKFFRKGGRDYHCGRRRNHAPWQIGMGGETRGGRHYCL